MSGLRPRLTYEERAELDVWADAEGHPRKVWQAYDETDSTEDHHGDVKIGEFRLTPEEAEQVARESGVKVWSVYGEKRCVTRDRKVWYMQDSSPVSTYW
jgi:hypothetical protein